VTATGEPDEPTDTGDPNGPTDTGEADEPTEGQLRTLAAALAAIDDTSLRRGLATMRESSRLEVAQYLNLSKATMHLGDALVPLARRKMVNASPSHQLGVAFALTEECNGATIAALGDRHEDPSRDDMLAVLPDVIEEHGTPMVTLMLAAYAASDAKCQAVFEELLETDERFALPDPPPVDAIDDDEPAGIVTFTRDANDPEQVAKRAQRKEAKAAKRAAAQAQRGLAEAAQSTRKQAQHRAKRRP
jgi:hypothetical protein